MSKSAFDRELERITGDTSRPIEDRLDEALALCPDEDDEKDVAEDSDKSVKEIAVYRSLIDMLWRECNDHSHDLTMLQLYVLLAEAYDDVDNYRPMVEVASGVLRLMRDGQTPVSIYKETIPRLAAAIGDSVYNHALYEILLNYVESVLEENPDDDAVRPHAAKLLKLHLLLEYDEWRERHWSKEFRKKLSRLFSPEELMNIIANPKIGHLNRDRVEYTRKWEQIYYDMEAELDERFANAPKGHGLCFHIWSVKRELLKEKYGIEWRSPAQMNPRVLFD